MAPLSHLDAVELDGSSVRKTEEARVPSSNRQCRHGLAFVETANLLTERIDPSDDGPAQGEGRTPALGMNPHAHEEIREGDASGKNSNAHLADSGSRDLFLDDSQILGTTEATHDHPLIHHGDDSTCYSVA